MSELTELIAGTLRVIHRQFYADRPREYFRDERALTKALARYGHECDQRGWHFEPPAIQRDLLKLLNEIKRAGADIGYLPIYLEGAITRHLGERAEELSAQAKQVTPKVTKILGNLKHVEAIREPTAVETLATLYRDLRRCKKTKTKAPAKQIKLL